MRDPAAYVVQSMSTVVHGRVDISRLHQAWEAVARVVDVLRTRLFMSELRSPLQVLSRVLTLALVPAP